jgi:DNA-binding NtrC family response regulator
MGQSQIVAKSRPLRAIFERLQTLAESNSTVLIGGETGTGKELFARAIHYLGPRGTKPFVTIDCGSIPESLVENELFGHARGAFTDAFGPGGGLIPEADSGTLFLDEVESLPLSVQSKFLRFIQERQYRPLGQSRYISVDERIVAATNIDLADAVEKRLFRKDLYYRLNVVPLYIPPLRERKSDIPALISYFSHKHSPESKHLSEVSLEVLNACMAYDWPGNVRELENLVQQWVSDPQVMSWGGILRPLLSQTDQIRPLTEVRHDAINRLESQYIHSILTYTRGNLSAAARVAQINRKTLTQLLKKHGMHAQGYRA